MNRPSTGTAMAVSGVVVAAAAVLIPLGSTELAGQSHPDIWSNAWITGGIAVLGLGVLLAVLFFLTDIFGRRSDDAPRGRALPQVTTAVVHDQAEDAGALPAAEDQAWQTDWSLAESEALPEQPSGREVAPGPAFTGRWQHTADGIKASPLMNMANTSMPGSTGMPGQSPYVRIGVCVASDPLPTDASSGQMGSKFLEFLSRDPVAGLISGLTHIAGGTSWTRLAGNGTLLLEATLGSGDHGVPSASAMFLSPVIGMSGYGRADGIACLWLHVEPRAHDGSVAQPGSLADWHEHLCRAISVAPALAEFLASDLGLATGNDPSARVGVLLQTPGGPMTGLVDPGELAPLPGASSSTQFLGYALADPDGKSAGDVARDLVRQLCDHTLYLGDFERVLAAIGSGGRQHGVSIPAVPDTWNERDLPVLAAVVKLLDEPDSLMATVSQIAAETGFDVHEVDRALERLKGTFIREYHQFLTGGDPTTWYVSGVTSAARRAVGQWPDH
jgi:hypothetical protein